MRVSGFRTWVVVLVLSGHGGCRRRGARRPHVLAEPCVVTRPWSRSAVRRHRRRAAGELNNRGRRMMGEAPYYPPTGGLPPQTQLLSDRAMFREAYAVIPRGTNSDIVTSFLPHWHGTRLW